MIRKLMTAAAIAAMIGSTGAAEKVFPSPQNPAGKDPANLTQYISIIIDDNGYSGLNGTIYEPEPGEVAWDEFGRVGGETFNSWEKPLNPLNIEEGDMGISWASNTLGVPVTFNMITGLYINTSNPSVAEGEGWKNRVSKLGHYVPRSEDGVDHNTIAIAWGREQSIEDAGTEIQPNSILDATEEALQNGHEFGNHTIDHMESNSLVPFSKGSDPWNGKVEGESTIEGFAAWGGEGADKSKLDTMPWGEVINEAEEYGQNDGASAQYMGWKAYAGSYISQDAWQGAIKLGEKYLVEDGNVPESEIYGFRAPRLEVSSGLYFGLAAEGYEYDCGLEEGFEEHRDGTNMLWPYTMDNGTSNTWTQYSLGERRSMDSMPADAGLWQIPVNALIVPEEIRSSVWANHAEVLRGEGDSPTSTDSSHWVEKSGKVTAFDFNAWIMWGMTKDNFLKTIKNTITLRMEGNKAPFHMGMHTDYHTPVYDNATLMTDFNKDAYGLCVVNGWNEWDDRTAASEEWVTWAKGQGAEFVTGHGLIEKMRDLKSQAPAPYDAAPADDFAFGFFKNENLNSTSTKESFSGSFDGTVVVDAPSGGEYPWASFQANNLNIEKLNYISLDYQSTSAIAIKLHMEGDAPTRQVILNNVNNSQMVSSGMIPLSAFDFSQYDESLASYDKKIDAYTEIDPTQINSVEIQPLAPENRNDGSYEPRTEPYEIDLKIENLTFYGKVEQTDPIINVKSSSMADLAVNTVNSNALKLNIAKAGAYDISIAQANGRIVKSLSNKDMTQGLNSVALNNLASGVYMINVKGINNNEALVQKAFIK
ncbi:MAG: hypothetical protein ACQEQV_03230 [Fibrobacterota bacterium]